MLHRSESRPSRRLSSFLGRNVEMVNFGIYPGGVWLCEA